MFARVAYDPGSEFQQRLHQTDLEMPDGATDAAVIRDAHCQIQKVIGIAVWNGDEWRTIHGNLPGLDS